MSRIQTAAALAFLLVMYGIVGSMDYAAAVAMEQEQNAVKVARR